MTERRGGDGASRERAARALSGCVVSGTERRPSLTQGRVRLQLSQRGSSSGSPCAVCRELRCTAERQCFLNQRALQGDKRPESRGKDGDILPCGAHPVNLSMKTQRTTVRRAGEDECVRESGKETLTGCGHMREEEKEREKSRKSTGVEAQGFAGRLIPLTDSLSYCCCRCCYSSSSPFCRVTIVSSHSGPGTLLEHLPCASLLNPYYPTRYSRLCDRSCVRFCGENGSSSQSL